MDDDFAAFLEELTPDQLNSTLVLILGDHGACKVALRAKYQTTNGCLEARLAHPPWI